MEKADQNNQCSSKGAFDAASLLGCSTAGTHAHENLGSELNDTVSLKHGLSSSSLHCHMAQPRRIVEEMLGHLYARPPSAEIKTELPVSGIHNTSQTIRTSTLVSSPPLISGNKLLRVKTNSIIKETTNSGKLSEKQMLDISESNNTVSTNPSIKNSSGKRKSSETPTDSLNMSKTSLNSLHNLNNKIKQKFDDSSISVSSQNGIQVKDKELKKHHKQKKIINKDSGSDTDIQSNESSSTSGSAENSSSSESGSDSSNSDSSDDGEEEEDEFDEEEEDDDDDDDDEKRRKNLKELRKQQQELRKKVQELKQASQEAQAHKAESHAKKSHGTKNNSFGAGMSLMPSSDVTLPSPAHSGSSVLFSGSPCKVTSGNQETEISVAPLDLCIKKQDSPADSTTILENIEVFSSKSSNAKNSHSRKKNCNKSKKIEKSLDALTNTKEENAFESGLENSDTDDTEQSATGSTTSNLCVSSSNRGTKRQFLDELDGPQKKKRILPDEKDIRIPLEYGWRRQTKIRCFSRSGVRGEVTYFAPCGKKLRNYPEVVRYLQRHGITDISRENFTFSTKINVGEFVEHSQGGQDDYLISEQEVIARIEEVRARKGRLGVQGRRFRTVDEEEEQISQWEDTQSQSTEKQVEETKRQKEHQRLTKQQERYDRLEQLRLERELRAQQMLEARRKRQEELERQRCEEALQKAQERERRRQHMLLVRALEARKKQEERERKREEILYEKRLNKEKKLEQRRLELQMIREMKKPIEDMCLKDSNPLPTLNRIPGVKLAGKAFADIMMVFEFLHNFGDTLGFDMENLPTLNTLQMALLNHSEKTEEELLSVVHHLLVCVISDPGVPHCPDAVSVLGHHLRDVDITNSSVSEVLRLYVTAQNKNSEMYHWLNQRPFLALNPMQKAEILAFLCNELLCSRAVIRQIDTNIECVNSLRKDKWLIEGDLRKLKCIQQKRVHTNYIKQSVADDIKSQEVTTQKNIINSKNKNIGNVSKMKTKTTRSKRLKDTETEENDIGGNESGNDTDDIQEIGHLSEGEIEYTALTNDELSRKIDKLNKQQTQYQNKLTRACHTIRATTFGQDRYKRRYWVLPFSGGIFVEGQESADPDNEKIKMESYKEINEAINIADDKIVVIDKDIKMDLTSIHSFNENELEDKNNIENLNIEKIKNTDSEKVVNNRETKDVNSTESELKLSTEWIDHKICVSPKQNDIFSPFTNQYIKSGNIEKMVSSKLNSSSLESDKISNSLVSGDQNWFLQSPFFASILAGSMLFNGPLMHNRELNGSYFNFPKDDLSLQDNSFGNFLSFPSKLLSSEQIVKNSENLSNQSKPWFSILPRMPCEHNSAISAFNSEDKKSSETQISNHLNSVSPIASTSNSSMKHNGTHLPLFQHSSATNIGSNPNHAAAAAIANLHVELMNGLPSSFFMHPFLSPQSFGPTYQNDPSISNAPNSVTSCITNISNSTPVTSNINNTSNSLQFTNSEILANFGLPNFPPASSTPSSIPTPSATPGPSHGSAPSSQRETPSPSFCRKYFVDKQDQFEEPQPIPPELQRGWWRITDPEQLKTLLNALHPRGIREKMLKKQLQKLFNYACLSCSKENREATDLEIIELDREISQKVGGTPDANNDDEWFSDVALRIDLAILEHVESMEEKVASASMQIKGWKMRDKLSNDPTITFYPACDSSAHYSSLQEVENNENERLEMIDKNSDINSVINREDKNDNMDEAEVNDELEKKIEDDDEDEKLKDTENTTKDSKRIIDDNIEHKTFNPVEVAKERLLLLEAAIERRYLRAPLGTSSELKLCTASSGKSQNTDEKDDDDIPVGLLRWRDSVNKCKTAAQLAMCINVLETCVAWDKSIMRASCQFCHNGDNEEMLLLCDGCDKGYHTYCFKPKMESIPDGDWYCYECLSKVTGEQVCILCGKKGKLLSCDACPKTFHLNCLEPPLSKMPKGKWSCPSCNHNKPKKTYKHKPKDKEKEKDIGKDHKDNSSKKSESSKSKNSDKRDKNKHNKDLSVCSVLLNELEKHEDAWPFLLPVNTKQFPTYRKIIKKPMDLTTMKNKLEGGMYKSRDEIASDARLIFDNCETFNEDDSPVGQAGHRMRAFFECRWMELTNT